MDNLTPGQRSRNMAAIGSKDTKPEIQFRSLLHRMGYRFRLHRKDLPGKPDVVLPKHRCVIFVHGCFWHRHSGCKDSTTPKSNTEFWTEKFRKNVARDRKNLLRLKEEGWKVIVVWQCELKDVSKLQNRLRISIDPKNLAC